MGGRGETPFTVRLGPGASAALEELCVRWGVGKAEAIRRAIREVASGSEGHRPVMEALSEVGERLGRVEARLAAGGVPSTTAPGAAPEGEAAGRAAEATRARLTAWALGEEE